MFRRVRLVLALLVGTLALEAQTRWIKLQNQDFRIYSQASEQETRIALDYFERVRSFFINVTGRAPSDSFPLDIVIFGSAAEYEPYRLNEAATAYHVGFADRDYIVLSKAGEQVAQTVTHEYFHLVSRHAGKRYPPWLEEGMAEMYSTLHPEGDDIEYGAPIPGRVRALARDRWVPLATILTADQKSPYYNEANKAGSLYDESWALVHFLSTSPEYNPRFPRLLQAIEGGTPSIRAIETVYGQSLDVVEQALRQAISGGFNRRLYLTMKLDPSKENGVVRPADMFEVKLALANLSSAVSKGDPRPNLEKLTQADSGRPEPWVQLAYLAWKNQNVKQAIEYFAKAYALGDHSPELLWDYGRLALREKPQESVRVLGELLKLEPDNLNARIELASAQTSARQPREALVTLSTIKSIDAEHGQGLFYTMAVAQVQLGQFAEARASTTRLQSVALSKEYRDRAAELLTYLDEQERRTPSGRAAAAAKTPAAGAQTRSLTQVDGRIVEMNCDGMPSVVIETGRGRKTYVLEPSRYAVTGNVPGGQGLRCGPQDSPPLVRILYEVLPADARGDGAVRELRFQ